MFCSQVSKVTLHPGYDPKTYANDIAVLSLDHQLDAATAAGAACLPPEPLQHFYGRLATVSGYGLNSSDAKEGTMKLQILTGVQILDSCSAVNNRYFSGTS
jgi:hypothetical protein